MPDLPANGSTAGLLMTMCRPGADRGRSEPEDALDFAFAFDAFPNSPGDARVRLSFHGGAQTVTGSRHLLHHDQADILIDAGLFQGLKKLRKRNWDDPGFDPRQVDAMFLTHTHIDHAGYLPRLVKLGLKCPVFCTPATEDLAELLLLDSAHIQEEDARYANKKGFSKHKPALPLYTERDVRDTLKLLKPVDYDEWIKLPKTDIRGRFINIGHILGSAIGASRSAG